MGRVGLGIRSYFESFTLATMDNYWWVLGVQSDGQLLAEMTRIQGMLELWTSDLEVEVRRWRSIEDLLELSETALEEFVEEIVETSVSVT